MEIEREIKAKVFAQYWGQKVFVWNKENHAKSPIEDRLDFIDDKLENYSGCGVLLLKPLSSITDEDALLIVKINGGINDNKMGFITEYSPIEKIKRWIISVNVFRADSYQYLQSKGYDLPQYLLGGKTLKEVGLAIYENEITK